MTTILEKIRKLLALSKSDNVNEAAAAAGAAQRLMQEHRIAEAELESAELPRERATLDGAPLDIYGESSPTWKTSLSEGLSRLHGCKVWLDWRREGARSARVVLIVGRPSDVASVRYLYAWLTTEIERLAQKNAMGRGRRYANSYRVGGVVGVLEAMRAADRDVRSSATGEALVRLDERVRESAAVVAGLGLRLHKSSAGGRLSAEAFERGQAAGRGLHTGAKLGAVRGGRLLGPG